tara:strand:+ start:1107 stop:1652 length:546 start_codon:yes stop_codon:yes gene_type:complete
MVKNKKGGNRHKKMASKNNQPMTRQKLRIAKEKDGEMYAIVTKVFGNGMCEVYCNDEVIRLLIIRRKFKGRNRRDNSVTLNGLLLVGIREWEVVAPKKKPKCDLLFVYNDYHKDELKRKDGFNEKMLWQIDGKKAVEEQEDGGVLFTHDIDDETPKINIIMNNDSSKKLDENESVVNWDDI